MQGLSMIPPAPLQSVTHNIKYEKKKNKIQYVSALGEAVPVESNMAPPSGICRWRRLVTFTGTKVSSSQYSLLDLESS